MVREVNHSPSSSAEGTGVPSPESKRMVREVNHSPSSSAEIKNEWRYTSAPPYCLLGLDRETCTFFLSFFIPL